MKRLFFFWFLLFLVFQAQAVDKSEYDLQLSPGLHKSASSLAGYGHALLGNDVSEISLLSGGYFTIGTGKGISTTDLDDLCNISFGHPYAKTSYPLLAVDGVWGKFDDLFSPDNVNPTKNGDTLLVRAADERIELEFGLVAENGGRTIKIFSKIKNLDNTPHQYGLGLVLDPALGLWGDGALQIGGESIKERSEFNDGSSSQIFVLSLWEKSEGARGLGVSIEFENNPSQLVVDNWNEIYNDPTPQLKSSDLNVLYDLCLKMLWGEPTLAPQEQRDYELEIQLETPDFSSPVFMRWDMPNALSMARNVLFPLDIPSTFRIVNTGATAYPNALLALDLPYEIHANGVELTGEFPIAGRQEVYRELKLHTREIYEDNIVPLTIYCQQNGVILDQITRNVYVPASPVSDTGLIVTIDSVMVTAYPKIEIILSGEIEATGQKLLNLRKENVFLYENENRISKLEFNKYTEGGSSLADVVFVLDCSGSMGNEINWVRSYLGEFADSLKTRGYDFRVGVVTFSTTVDDVWDLTDDVEQIKRNLATVDLWGGVEDSPAALYRASQLSFRPGSRRNILWITDEPYPEHSYTKQQIVDRMLAMDITVHGVGLTDLQTDWFNPIVLPTGGNFYDINGNFRDILLDVSRMASQDHYLLAYNSSLGKSESRQIRLVVHYAGLGGEATIDLNPGELQGSVGKLACYPNPFNPEIKLLVRFQKGMHGDLAIFNILGQQVKKVPLKSGGTQEIIWNALDDHGSQVGSGFYIVRLSLSDERGNVFNEHQKILYLK